MNYKKFIITGTAIIAVIVLLLIINFYKDSFIKKQDKEAFTIDNLFLKISMETDKNVVNNIKITNNLDWKESFSIVPVNLDNLVSIKESNFEIESNKEKSIAVSFNTNGKKPAVYFGGLKIISAGTEKIIPIILEVQSNEIVFDSNVNLYPQGDVILGQKLSMDIKIFDLKNNGLGKINLIYSVNDIEGKKLVSGSEDIVVGGKLDYLKIINLPENIEKGSYVLSVVINYKNSVGTSTTIFNVVEKSSSPTILENKILITWIVIIFGFFFLAFFVLFFYSLVSRDKVLEEIQAEYKTEIKKQNELIKLRQKQGYKKLGNSLEKRIYRRELEKVRKLREKAIEEVHNERIKEYKRIKRKGDEDKLIREIKKWRGHGYDISDLDRRFRIPTISDIRSKMELLGSARSSGYISEESYRKGRERLQKLARK